MTDIETLQEALAEAEAAIESLREEVDALTECVDDLNVENEYLRQKIGVYE